MVVYRRDASENPDEIYFLTLVTRDRENIFTERADYINLWNAFKYVTELYDSELFAFVFLPNHLHILLRQGNVSFSNQIARFKKRVNWHYCRNRGTIWQQRFWEHRIRDDDDLIRHADYIHYNPVKHGLVRNPCDWSYSSFQRFVKEGIYTEEWSSQDDLKVSGEGGE